MQPHGIIPGRERSLLVLNFFYKILTFVMGGDGIGLKKHKKALPVCSAGKANQKLNSVQKY
uniref:Uncharacterized protein n=1 Tax=Paenibacillus polymyxa TaxID=1406 RepID=A0AAE9PQ93_PAEPO